jgi:hypothetical protein
MINQQAAAQDLKVIRSLMERATIYRTISGPTALFGAVLALVTAAVFSWLSLRDGVEPSALHFVAAWLVILALAAGFNFLLIHRDAARRNDLFVSPGMRLALRTISPPLFVGGLLGISLTLFHGDPAHGAIVWILCYGLALCATAGFAPKSIKILGAAFLCSGTLLLFLWHAVDAVREAPAVLVGSLFMGATFGLLHLVYAFCVGVRGPLQMQSHDGATA